jgi:hypothetical protein
MTGGIAAVIRSAALLAAFTLAAGCSGPPPAQAPKTQAAVNEPNGNSPAGILPGAIYRGLPDFTLAGELLRSGGYPGTFSAQRAFAAMLGPQAASAERGALAHLYGSGSVDAYFRAYSFALNDFAAIARGQQFIFPRSQRTGTTLAAALLKAGTDPHGTFSMGYLFDHLMVHATALRVLRDMQLKPGYGAAAIDNLSRVGNAMHYELAQRLGVPGVQLALSDWTTTENIRAVAGGPKGTRYMYAGTGAPSGNEYAARLVDVQPGHNYVFSAWVDPAYVSKGSFDLAMTSADGTASYAAFFHSAGAARRYSTHPWACPPQVHRVLLLMQLSGATIASGRSVAFADPELQSGVTARPL